MVIRGPIEMVSSDGFVCNGCGRSFDAGYSMFLGRAAGKNLRTCCKKCWHLALAAREKELADVKE